ncbi:hypothetical protein [Marinobacter sp.]|uniref:hypothetical protein n=1 Tax=Marinobacter sp. TaxID=50741 RepID=UPI00384FAF05
MQHDSDLNKLIKTKLALIDQDCESETRGVVNNLYSGIKYEGGRLHVPDFQKAANLMAAVISCKEKRFNSEISRILSTSGGFRNSNELERAKEHVSKYFEEDLYLKRFDGFLEGVERAAGRYGLKFDGRAYRTDIASSLFEVAIKNSARRAVASVHAELAIHLHSDRLEPRENLPGANDIVDLKPNFMGFGINFNALIKRLQAKCRNGKT